MTIANQDKGSVPIRQLPETGYLRLPQIIGDSNAKPPIPAIIPIGKSTWWAGIKSGRFPNHIRELLERSIDVEVYGTKRPNIPRPELEKEESKLIKLLDSDWNIRE